MMHLTDAVHGLREIAPGTRVGPLDDALGTLLAVDTVRRVDELMRLGVHVVDVPSGWEHLNIHPARGTGRPDVVLHRTDSPSLPPYGDPLAARLAWLSGDPLGDAAQEELTTWRRDVARWAEEPSKPMCAQVQQDVLAALCEDLQTRRAIDVLRGSMALGLPDGCLFETWAWADRLLGLDLTRDVGR